MYDVYGYDLINNEACLLHSAWTEREAIDWAKKYSFRDMGGWNKICVQYEREVDVDVTEEVIIWCMYEEPTDSSELSLDDNAHEEF